MMRNQLHRKFRKGGDLLKKDILRLSKNLGMRHNVCFNVIDISTGKIVQQHIGHNTATNSMLTGIAHYLVGDGVLNQGASMLSAFVPKYISLGTMGLGSQEADADGYPADIGSATGTEEEKYEAYMTQVPGYGSDGYDPNLINNREWFGLGPVFADRPYPPEYNDSGELVKPGKTIDCELISDSFPRTLISFRDIVPETESEVPQTIDVVFSAMVSTGALAQFRESGKDYIFITEAGLWSRPSWVEGGDNGLLAGYRIAPPDHVNWGMSVDTINDLDAATYLKQIGIDDPTADQIQNIKPELAQHNRKLLKSQILRVGVNQVVQVIWKIQLGAIDQLVGITGYYPVDNVLRWVHWS